ncbi:sigma-54-dependent Fis family transcriptional regulator [Bacillus amyloliquefaciens]|uniref:Sigma-54-dependent Fis family transcriptional regulator n=2 Tax=Bacillus TaxID=1386 RepID=A0A6A8LI52_BACVE|nr:MULTISPECIES: sigma-54-dependent Fis family transcriptional regulator [Bacillus]APB82791.1 sigma-54-dependent Fis family transcriptional regulator [Bacillus amyloliquefaciens]ASZ04207.1 sigma-54-dependent Fis family transcriptional regulator [Bacillus velezensis]AVX16815.1 sigma-54-dependent Fis family transcriptional regulator [Bacillus sp. ZY-1-1]AWM83655.1 sigma-54-dependent Fis family transcriptional regulator [Bacillus velezensis]MBD0397516.1 sigma-54-dependent Fis family transcription
MQKVLIIGAGKGGTALLQILMKTKLIRIIAVVDQDPEAQGLQEARRYGIATSSDWKPYITEDIDIIIHTTGDKAVMDELLHEKKEQTIVMPGKLAYMVFQLMEEKQQLIQMLKSQTYKHDRIFNSTHDGMIFIDVNETIILFNQMAEKMVGRKREDVIGRQIKDVVPNTKLPRILETREPEYNQKQLLGKHLQIVTTRLPIIDEGGKLLGALCVFKDITDAVELAEEVTNLKQIRTMLEAIIQSSDEAISVVDENGIGMLINKAYTKMTGLSESEVIGKPASTDISEGESMHLKVLGTRRPVRGVRMKVGPNKKDVIVNVAPVIVDGILKGSVGVIHDVSEIKTLTAELNRARQIIRTLEAKYTFDDIIGTSEQMLVALEQAKLGAKTPATILLRGESGTGKELFAHAIHNESDRKYNKFIRVNCAALSESLLESELFGYEEGAFTGARRGGKKGLFEEANNGSIFLDEIGELTQSTQAKLLRVLQEKEIIRVGGAKAISVNVRIIAATNVNIEKAMAEGAFREDLYYRINRYPISIPPLRQRKEDIEALSIRLIEKINQDYGRNVKGLTPNALRALSAYSWPGNVRELENVLGRAMIFLEPHMERIEQQHLPVFESELNDKNGTQSDFPDVEGEKLSQAVEKFEAHIIQKTLEKHKFNRTKTAKALGVSIRNLYYKMDKYGLANDGMQ